MSIMILIKMNMTYHFDNDASIKFLSLSLWHILKWHFMRVYERAHMHASVCVGEL